MNYSPSSTKENGFYYPVVKFYSQVLSDCYIINQKCLSRNEALKAARQTIDKLNKSDNKIVFNG